MIEKRRATIKNEERARGAVQRRADEIRSVEGRTEKKKEQERKTIENRA